ncbi:carboxylesterase/lipase family protein [Paenibacillus fonticola]|uniref:carboxylesterase/lipase family protein n=1 Tax=Paenibacillus fonticola TaxID=379896 RepID=UPI00038031D9|nr:carboxylesterase/lipase family protein [Paenibacillus fonticola]
MYSDIVETGYGKVRGLNKEGINVYKGIPYGGSTEGSARFMPPTRPASWTGVRDVFDYGPACFQTKGGINVDNELTRTQPPRKSEEFQSENCLVLNVWSPGTGDGKKRPVLFWCHGGGYFAGSGSNSVNDGTNLARRGDVVVVTINHRLGPLGFLYLKELGGSDYGASGNAGMLDIVAALKWVRDNIEAFGGDPGNVTLFGHSGGGGKVSTLLAMPAAKGLFHRAVIQGAYGLRMMESSAASETTERILAVLGLKKDQLERLHQLHPKQLWDAYYHISKWDPIAFAEKRRNVMNIGPVVDGMHLPHHPFDPVGPEISAHIPIMIGTTKDESTIFLGSEPNLGQVDEAGMRQWLKHYVGEQNVDRVIVAYLKDEPNASPNDLLVAVSSDVITIKDSIVLAERKIAPKGAPVYMYRFEHESPTLGGKMKSLHGLEIPFVFDNLHKSTPDFVGDAPGLSDLAANMSQAWINFASSGNPNHDGLPAWPPYNLEERPTMVFDKQCNIVNDPRREGRRVLDQLFIS